MAVSVASTRDPDRRDGVRNVRLRRATEADRNRWQLGSVVVTATSQRWRKAASRMRTTLAQAGRVRKTTDTRWSSFRVASFAVVAQEESG
jgi:hypothetical protein